MARINEQALDEAVRRFPALLAAIVISSADETRRREFLIGLIRGDASTEEAIRAEYRRIMATEFRA